ncbi:MAG: hypothetical protein ACWGNV_09195 [Bacteroidales bacterium]
MRISHIFLFVWSWLCPLQAWGLTDDPASGSLQGGEEDRPLSLCPENPRYLQYRGKPVLLVTSAEHYGAVINMDFDEVTYLETLSGEGFNYTRIFGGTYIEPVENIFGIEKNTLAPLPGRFLAPWEKADGLYDLDRFSGAYLDRLTGFLSEAEQRGIIVELTLFTSIYAEGAWALSPLNAANNSNLTETPDFRRVNTLYNDGLKKYQEHYIRKLVRELNRFDNLFYEIQNEPWADNGNLAAFVNEEDDEVFTRGWQKRVEIANGVSMEWQAWVASVIRDEESRLPQQHLIAQNIGNFAYDLKTLPEGVSIVNFHYALPEAVIENMKLGGVTGLDETGFMPHDDAVYLRQAWRFILSGGGLYNNLDYSFTTGHETGDWPIPASNPGWGGPGFRKKLSLLVSTMKQVPFHEMEFSDRLLRSDPADMKQYGLVKPGEVSLVYVEGFPPEGPVPQLPAGSYAITWIDIHSGEQVTEQVRFAPGTPLKVPFPVNEAVLKIEHFSNR